MNKCLKATSILLIYFISIGLGFSQEGLKQGLQGEWVKDKISLKDGSPIFDENFLASSFSLDFRSDSLIVSYDGKNIPSAYRLKDSVISYRNTFYKIARLDKPILEVYQVNHEENVEPIRITFHYKPILDLSYVPEFYLAKNNEKVYLNKANEVEAKFLDSKYTAMEFIYVNFRYPEYRKGGYVVRFVINKNGELKGLRMIASSNEKFEEKLISAINKTRGKWLAATYQGKNVNCEIEFNFDLGWTEENYQGNVEAENKEQAAEYEANGKWYYGAKNYKSAIYYFSKALEINPYLIDSYYMRAASYASKKDMNNACGDYLQLKNLGQKKADALFEKHCKDYKTESKQ